jgi:hypothetical protein
MVGKDGNGYAMVDASGEPVDDIAYSLDGPPDDFGETPVDFGESWVDLWVGAWENRLEVWQLDVRDPAGVRCVQYGFTRLYIGFLFGLG